MTLQHTRRIVKSLFILFIIVVCIYLLPRVAINAFYYPDNKVYGPTPAEAESITFTAKDGTHLHGWFIPTAFGRPENAVATVIHVHGNAGNMSAHWPLVSWLPERNVNLFMFDYRGFGESEGTPSQEGLLDDTKSAIDYVIPWQDSEKLYALAREPKQKIFIPDGDHIDAFSGRYANLYRDAMIKFIQTALSAK
ncbi:alpha/beta hydrolase [Salmonella enterica subsp. enterica serovar Derby]|nr:alpha/beta hydrolase [Salmonella enterica subsp. enterica serovar Derby]EHJ9673588.1 alpha/beta hydrolase [Salmonella enterica subsp. enterica serovar Derby]